ncbi:hypothetical protein V8F20_008863 [Naviculisporaceae sp. PSN 640]
MTTTFFSGSGYNSLHGRDVGLPPPRSRRPSMSAVTNRGPPQGVYDTPWGPYFVCPVYLPQGMISGQPQQAIVPVSSPRTPQPTPIVDPSMPALNLTNSTGGVGCEPGYNYFFPADHTKIIVLRGSTPPWQMDPKTDIPQYACHVPTKTTIAELMDGLGGKKNPNKKLNTVTEVAQGGNGRWFKGLSFSGADSKKDLRMTIEEVGWDKSRTGRTGEKPVVYLYLSNE